MRKAWAVGAALALAMLAGGPAHADSPRDADAWDRSRGTIFDRDEGWNRGDSRHANRSYLGVWRLAGGRGGYESGSRDGGWGDRRDSRGGMYGARAGFLPEVIRIERDGRDLRVEDARGRLLREVDRDSRRGALHTWMRTRDGRRIAEVFTLERNGQRLVVRTTVSNRGGTRTFTSVYTRA